MLSARGMTLVTAAAPRSVDVGSAARSLIGKVDVIYTNTDNNVVSAYEALAKVGQDAKIPLIASDATIVRRGAVAGLGVDYKALGRQAGVMAIRIFNGEKPGNIKPETSNKILLYVNPGVAAKQGVTLSEDLLKDADEIIR